MYLTVQRRRVPLDASMWLSPEDIMARAKAAAQWPACRIFLEWDNGKEPITTEEELRFAARLVHTHHCSNLYLDKYVDLRPPRRHGLPSSPVPPSSLPPPDNEDQYPHVPIPFPPARPSPPNSPPYHHPLPPPPCPRVNSSAALSPSSPQAQNPD